MKRLVSLKASAILRPSFLGGLVVLVFGCSLLCLLYKIPLDSDRLYFDDLFRDLLSGGRFSQWRLAVAPGYFPDLLLYSVAYKLLPFAPLRLMFVSALQALLCWAAAIWIAKEVRPTLSLNVPICLLAMLALVIVASTRSGAWVFLNSNNAHVGAALCFLLSLAALLRWARTRSVFMLPLLIVLGVAGTLSTALYFLCFPVAALIAVSIAAFRDRQHSDIFILAAVSILAGQAMAYGMRRLVVFNDVIGARVPMSFEAARHASGIFVANLQALLSQPWSGLLVTILTLLCFAIVLRVAMARIGQFGAPSNRFAAWFWLLAVLVTAVGGVLSGGFGDPYAFRYFGGHIALAATIAVVVLDTARPAVLRGVVWLVTLATLVAAPQAYSELRNEAGGSSLAYMARYGKGRIGEEDVALCIDRWVASGLPLRAGASQYWLARSVELRTPDHPMLAVFADLKPFFWMSTSGPMLRPEHYVRYYNFLLVQTAGEVAPFNFTPTGLAGQAPVPDRVVDCGGSPVQIWYYQTEALNRVIEKQSKQFVESEGLR
jgi:hypothetical protein